jgi:signal transduction histidine kinase/CheY-like chemotaxis protein
MTQPLDPALANQLLDQTEEMLLLVNPATLTIAYANQPACQLLGYDRDNLQHMEITRIECALSDLFYWDEVRQGRQSNLEGVEGLYLCADGATLAVTKTIHAIHHGGANWLLIRAIDSRLQKRVEDQLAQSTSLLRATLEATADGIMVVDRDGVIVNMNRRFAELWRIPEALLERHDDAAVFDFIATQTKHPVSYCARLAAIAAAPDDESFDTIELADQRVFERKSRPQHLGEHIIGRVFSFTDVTARVQVEQQMAAARDHAEAANRAKSDFLANMSHEIRTPMNAILGMAEMLGETDLSPDQRKYVEVFQNAGNNLLDLINDILDLSKVEAGQLELDETDFELGKALEEQIQLLAIRAYGKGLELALDIRPDVPAYVHGDAKRLKQCITNLVGNAIKFTDHGGIIVTVQRYDDKPDLLLFSVSDNGIGIPPEKHGAIFDAFTQADGSVTRKYGGTGLGLTITQRLVELMGGEIWLDSQIGKGSTFSFTARLPAVTNFASAYPAQLNLQGLRVLVVDDFPINRTIVCQYLKPLGAESIEAGSGTEALDILQSAADQGKPFDIALIDCHMPVMDGIELGRMIRANVSLRNTHLLLLTSDDTLKQKQRSREIGITSLLKPIRRNELVQTITHELQPPMAMATTPSSPPSVEPDALPPLSILLAEDNLDNVLLIQVMLKSTHHHLEIAENGRIAVEKFELGHYDLVLMDVQMPELDGYAATREIRHYEASQGRNPTPIFALTAHALKEDEQKSLDAGCTGHITKPVKKKVLLDLVDSIKQNN